MLTEARVDFDRMRELVFGLGLNIAGDAATFPPELQERATTLAAHTRQPPDVNTVAASVIATLQQAYQKFITNEYADALMDDWPRFDVLAGAEVAVHCGSETLNGTARGIDTDGCLILELPGGSTRALNAGEVTLSQHP